MSELDQLDIFKSDVDRAKKILKDHGYKVRDPKKKYITPVSKLISYFYQRLSFIKGIDYYSKREGKDRSIAKELLSRFLEEGCPQESVLDRAFEVINYLILNEDKVGIRFPITDMSVLGQGNMKWVTDKTIMLITLEKEARFEMDRNRLSKELEKKTYRVDYESKLEELNEILRRKSNCSKKEEG